MLVLSQRCLVDVAAVKKEFSKADGELERLRKTPKFKALAQDDVDTLLVSDIRSQVTVADTALDVVVAGLRASKGKDIATHLSDVAQEVLPGFDRLGQGA